jgi:primosomal protein N' (replication factor Y)
MFIVRVIPITRGIFKDYLSFFSRESMPAGSVISVPVRGKRVPSLVIDSRDAREEKLDIRRAGYVLKKLPAGIKARRIFSEAFIRGAMDTALWHGIHEGAAFGQLVSHIILASAQRIKEAPAEKESAAEPDEMKARADRLVLQAERGERIRTYRNLAREAFAREASVLIVAPTVIEAELLAEELARGIEERVVTLTSELPKKKLIANWNHAVASKEPVLIVGTPFVLSLPRADIDAIIIERESARAYRKFERPHLDLRHAALRLSVHSGARLICADFPLRVETRYLLDARRAEELARAQARPAGTTEVLIVDARKGEETRRSKRTFSTITDASMKRIEQELARGGRVAVYAARRGIAPLTVCNDCGTPVTDPVTGAPMVLHKTTEGNVFLSHRSGATVPAHISCRTCGGWNLVTLGIGIDRVYDELAKRFSKAHLSLLTTDSAPTHAMAKKVAHDFFTTRGAVLVGTERMLPYFYEPVELSVVASIDSFLSLPAWRAHEHVLSILFYLREQTENALIVETREPEHLVMKTLTSGNPADFYREDIAERQRYGYPPFALFVGLSMRGTPAAIEKLRLLVKESFSDLDLVGPLPAEQIGKSEWRSRAVIRLPAPYAPRHAGENARAWPDPDIAERLRALPPSIEVTIDPDEIV